MFENFRIKGTYFVECHDSNGNLLWTDHIDNLIATVGKNLTLDGMFSGSGTTAYMGLVTSAGYSAISASDTMSSHGGWGESANYGSTRKTTVWSSASGGSKSLSAGLVFTMAGADTIKGCFLVFGSGASATVANTSGTLLSAGLFTGGDKVLSTSDTLTVNYTISV